MNSHEQARAELEIANAAPASDSIYFVLRSIALSLIAIGERMESIDHARTVYQRFIEREQLALERVQADEQGPRR